MSLQVKFKINLIIIIRASYLLSHETSIIWIKVWMYFQSQPNFSKFVDIFNCFIIGKKKWKSIQNSEIADVIYAKVATSHFRNWSDHQ